MDRQPTCDFVHTLVSKAKSPIFPACGCRFPGFVLGSAYHEYVLKPRAKSKLQNKRQRHDGVVAEANAIEQGCFPGIYDPLPLNPDLLLGNLIAVDGWHFSVCEFEPGHKAFLSLRGESMRPGTAQPYLVSIQVPAIMVVKA